MNDIINIKTRILINASILDAMPLYRFHHTFDSFDESKYLLPIENTASINQKKLLKIIQARRLHLVLGKAGRGIEGALTITINQKKVIHHIGDIKDSFSNLIDIIEKFINDNSQEQVCWIEDTSHEIIISSIQDKNRIKLSVDEYKRYLDYDDSQFDNEVLPLDETPKRISIEVDETLFYTTIFNEAEKLFQFLIEIENADESYQLERINELRSTLKIDNPKK